MAGELATVSGGYTQEQIDIIKTQICRGANNDEMKMFLMVCQRSGLDPFARQIHAVKRWNPKTQREDMTIQTGIDGFRLIAERTGKYAGNDDPVYDTEDAPHPKKASVTVWKMVGGQRVPFTRSARWSEFVQTKKDGSVTKFWASMPYLMLGKVAEALALRTAFPQELSGLYTSDEMGQADNESEVQHQQPHPPQSHPQQQQSHSRPAALPPRQQPVADVPPDATGLVDGLVAAVQTAATPVELEAAVFAVQASNKQRPLGQQDGVRVMDAVQSKVLHLIRECQAVPPLDALNAVYCKSILPLMNDRRKAAIVEAFEAQAGQLNPPQSADDDRDPFGD